MLSQENLEKLGELPKESSIMAKFLKDNKIEMTDVAAEIENNMPFAMSYYNEEAKTPYLFRRISSTSTIKSVYFKSSPSSSASQESVCHEIKLLIDEKPKKNIYYNIMIAGDSGLGKSSFISTYMYLKFTDRTRCANPQAKNIKVLEKTKKLLKKENLSTISVRKINKSYDNIMISAWNTEHND